MKKPLLAVLLLLTASAVRAEAPSVTSVSLSQDAETRQVTISYVLANAPAIVTLDILTNGVSIGASNVRTISGPINCRVDKSGTYTVTWLADRDWEGALDASVRAEVKAWRLSRPPDYMVVDLVVPSNVCYYASDGDLPGGLLENRDYSTTKLVMRRISASGRTFQMGVIGEDTGNGVVADEKPHPVTMSADYWIGVFEFTQAQWAAVKGDGSRPSMFSCDADWATRPVEQVSYGDVRGSDYPAAPAAGSLLAALRSQTGQLFDLPSEAEWEYACRAGTGESMFNDGTPYTNAWQEVGDIGRFKSNGGGTYTNYEPEKKLANSGTASAGSYSRSFWGTYDMHGNVAEMCLDKYGEDITALNGAVNTAAGDYRVSRGGSYVGYFCTLRSGARRGGYYTTTMTCNLKDTGKDARVGFRVACPLVTE